MVATARWVLRLIAVILPCAIRRNRKDPGAGGLSLRGLKIEKSAVAMLKPVLDRFRSRGRLRLQRWFRFGRGRLRICNWRFRRLGTASRSGTVTQPKNRLLASCLGVRRTSRSSIKPRISYPAVLPEWWYPPGGES